AAAGAVQESVCAGVARLVIDSPTIDGLILVVPARSAKTLARQRADLEALVATAAKPILMWSYRLPAASSITLVRDMGYALITDIRNCARAFAAMADYRALRERFLKP